MNQPDIVDALRECGATVCHTHTIGHGAPGLLVGFGGVTYLMEVKSGKAQLSPDEAKWHLAWKGGNLDIVRSPDEAVDVITRGAREVF